jgi:RNAse (barnase) inhibitor barstar
MYFPNDFKDELGKIIFSPSEPYFLLLILGKGKTEYIKNIILQDKNIHVFVINGRNCKNDVDLFHEFARTMNFPSYFGNNWDAFSECIGDLEWISAPAYVIYIINAEKLLEGEEESKFKILIEILEYNAKEWSQGRIEQYNVDHAITPFHIVFLCDERDSDIFISKLTRASVKYINY